MTRFGESRFSVGSNSKSAQKAYADNYDRIFGKKPADKFVCPHGQDCVHGCPGPADAAKRARDKFEAWQDGYVDDDGEFRQG